MNFSFFVKKINNIKYKDLVFFALFLFVSIVVTLIILYPFHTSVPRLKVGNIANRNIKSDRNFEYIDEKATQREKQEIENRVLSVYNYDSQFFINSADKLKASFHYMRDSLGNKSINKNNIHEFDYLKEEAEKKLGFKINKEFFSWLLYSRVSKVVERRLLNILSYFRSRMVIYSKQFTQKDFNRGIVLRWGEDSGEQVLENLNYILDIKQAHLSVKINIRDVFKNYKAQTRSLLEEFTSSLVQPNVVFNKELTEKRLELALAQLKPIVVTVKKGEMIIREGVQVDEKHLQIINHMVSKSQEDHSMWILILIGVGIVIFLSMLFLERIINLKSLRLKDCVTILILFIMQLLIIKTGVLVSLQFDEFKDIFLYILPINLATVLLSVILGRRIALVFTLAVSILSGVFILNNPIFMVYALFSGALAVKMFRYCNSRSKINLAALKLGLVTGIVVILLNMKIIFETGLFWQIPFLYFFSLVSSLLIAPLLYWLSLFFEAVFGYATDIKLLELANLNHPLLKELMVKAPGTYHHSMMVGTLVEFAAHSIGANPLLAKAGAYYHDIGKITKPMYFVENQQNSENKHDKLSPNMSALILISHVKDGVDIAHKYKLGDKIIDIIRQHHGTSIMSYFYNKAQNTSDSKKEVDENDYRYPGPKPQSREAALVMIADSAEAAVRSLQSPNNSRIKIVISEVISKYFLDGQLEECDLSLKDLHRIANEIYYSLVNIYHSRVVDNGNNDKKKELETQLESSKDKEDDVGNTEKDGNK